MALSGSSLMTVPSEIARFFQLSSCAPSQPHAETDAKHDGARKFFSVGNWDKSCLLLTDFDDAHGDGSRYSSTSTSLAFCARCTHTSSTCPSPVAIYYFCDRNHRFALSGNRIAEHCLDVSYQSAFFQRLQDRKATHFAT